MLVLRTGIDLIEIHRLADQDPDIRERFIQRVFTPAEQAACKSLESLAGRFAAKEAAAKALGCGIGRVAWQDIEILTDPTGAPLLVLHHEAKFISDQLGIQTWSVSITHTRTTAAAVAVAIGNLPDTPLP